MARPRGALGGAKSQGGGKIVGKGRLQFDAFVGHRVTKTKCACVQEWPGQIDTGSAAIVSPIANNWVTYGSQVHPNLVGPSRLEPTRKQRCLPGLAETLEDLVVSQRGTPAVNY